MPYAYVNGTTLNYNISGEGMPIVFIHPPLLTSQTFAYQHERLCKEYQVITFDIRGHGRSEATVRAFSYSLIVEDIRQLLDFLGIERAFLCGYSTGGSIVLEALLNEPKRFLGGIVVSGMSELSDVYNKSLIWLASQMAGSRLFHKLLVKAITYGNADKQATFQHLYEDSLMDADRTVSSYYRCSQTYNCTSRLGRIQTPILLIYGEKDRRFTRYANLLHSGLPHSSLYFIKDAQHQIPTKEAERMNGLIHLWIESLDEPQTERLQLDLEIAKKLNPALYVQSELENSTSL
ncbi:alpha/beta hydrolase [Paenibacillus sp. SYP-B3998]|uniref:alpha/beta fold hydrolase n=1 Tax=Paenibacillus sp. SYP-B3998 TaxID=2678564 RepID=UPI001F08560B|nr:alpha/beta hydrolase [Paenibacillus sp. SYP-B3998]